MTVALQVAGDSGGEWPASISAALRRCLGKRSKTERRRRAVAGGASDDSGNGDDGRWLTATMACLLYTSDAADE